MPPPLLVEEDARRRRAHHRRVRTLGSARSDDAVVVSVPVVPTNVVIIGVVLV